MGWLRDLMSSAVPPLRSYDEFARQALLHSAWPESSRMKSRSLSALCSKLDKKSDLKYRVSLPNCSERQFQVCDIAWTPSSDPSTAMPD